MTGQFAVLDNEALQALVEAHHAKHRDLLITLLGASYRSRRGRVVRALVPTAVRVEAGVPRVGVLDRWQIQDSPLDTDRADRAAVLVRDEDATAIDATVAELARSLDGVVTVYTSDVSDLRRLLRDSSVSIRRI